MSDHEFHSSEPMAAPADVLRPGAAAPDSGAYACTSCPEEVTATLITMEKDEALPICNTCGRMTVWSARR